MHSPVCGSVVVLFICYLFSLSLVCVQAADVYIPFNNSKVEYVGRTVEMNITNGMATYVGRVYDWSAVSVEVTITGSTKISVFMAVVTGREIAFSPVIDGEVYDTIFVNTSKVSTEYVITTRLSTGQHKISIVRLTEPTYGSCVFYGFGLSAGGSAVTPAARPNRRIQFVGDSITCGYGNIGPAGCSGNGPRLEDAYQAHAALTARLLGADLHIVAWSGKGMVRNVNAPTSTSDNTMPTYFNKTLANTSPSPLWNYNSWVPHAVFINLGTNDYSGSNATLRPTRSQYTDGYVEFVNKLKSIYNPVPKFFFACGVMSNAYCAHLRNVSERVGAGSYVVDLFDLKVNATGRGCDTHPNTITDANMAQAQAAFMAPIMGWSVSPTTGAVTSATTAQATTAQATTAQATTAKATTTTAQATTAQATTAQATTAQSTTAKPSTSSSATPAPATTSRPTSTGSATSSTTAPGASTTDDATTSPAASTSAATSSPAATSSTSDSPIQSSGAGMLRATGLALVFLAILL